MYFPVENVDKSGPFITSVLNQQVEIFSFESSCNVKLKLKKKTVVPPKSGVQGARGI